MNTRNLLTYIALLLTSLLSSCSGEWARPPMIEPVAPDLDKVNTTISSLKDLYWSDERNYVAEIGRRDGKDIYIMGRVISSDRDGNIYKSIVLQDHTGALSISVNGSSLYKNYHYGQQVVVRATGLRAGGYNGLFQVGGEGSYGGNPSITFLDLDLWESCAQVNGLSQPERIDTVNVSIPELISARQSAVGLKKWQSQLVRIADVTFTQPGQPLAGKSATDRYLKDSYGNQIALRTSAYADFAHNLTPTGTGSVTGILSYYGTDWQLLLNDIDGLEGFDAIIPGEPTEPTTPGEISGNGSSDSPFTVDDVLAGATGSEVWVTGYIVGSVTDKSYESAHLGVSPAVLTNVLIASDPDETEASRCLPVQLPYGDVRSKVNLVDNPGNYRAAVVLKGNIDTYFSVPGIKVVTVAIVDGGQGEEPDNPGDNPEDSTPRYEGALSITSGSQYLIVADSKCAKPLTGSYGYLQVADIQVKENNIYTDQPYAFTLTEVMGGYYIQQPDGRYLYMEATRNSFNVTDEPADGAVWSVTFKDGSAIITNVTSGKSIQLDDVYGTFGAYSDIRGSYPVLYEKVN